MSLAYSSRSVGPGPSHAFAREVIKATRAGLTWAPRHQEFNVYDTTLPDGRKLSFCSSRATSSRSVTVKNIQLVVEETTDTERSTRYLKLSRRDTRCLLRAVHVPELDTEAQLLRPIELSSRCRRHRFCEIARSEASGGRIVITQRCGCGAERKVVQQPLLGGIVKRTVAIRQSAEAPSATAG